MALSLRTRQVFRRKCQKITLTIRLALFLLIPSLYLLANKSFRNDTKETGKELSDLANGISMEGANSDIEYALHGIPDFTVIGRRLLQAPETVKNCTPAAILDFPSDGLTRSQRKSGLIAVHCIIACYCFILLAIVCDDYFVPAIEKMCHKLKMAEDIAGATFMAAASSSPELFINCVGTFITEGDIGVGTIVGSAVFNILAVPACCGLLAGQVVDLDWWAVSRDSLMYGIAVISLIFTLQDDKVEWYEALILVGAYVFYILAMYFNTAISKLARSSCCIFNKPKAYTEITPLVPKEKRGTLDIEQNKIGALIENGLPKNGHIVESFEDDAFENCGPIENEHNKEVTLIENGSVKNGHIESKEEEALERSTDIWNWPEKGVSIGGKLFWIATWPISFVLWLSIPDCRKYPKLFGITFGMCIVWIGATSYLVAWLITCIGDTIEIPDSVMGLTFLAAGTSVPEAVSSIIVTNQGHGSMGISNSIGSNTFDILLCLGLPWLIKSVFYPAHPGHNWVNINSGGLEYSAISLMSTLFGLYIAFVFNKFRLDWKIGLTCTFMYIAFLALATLIELNMFFPVNLPTCLH